MPHYSPKTGERIIHKFGEAEVGTTIAPICSSGFYRMPTAATALELVSDDATDNSSGVGAREVTVEGLDANFAKVSQTVVPNGTTPVALGTNLIRLFRWHVSASGTYGTQTAVSHAGTLTIRESGAGQTWSSITNSPFSEGQSEVGFYSAEPDTRIWIKSYAVSVDSTKSIDLYLFRRTSADTVAAPFSSWRIVQKLIGISGSFQANFNRPIAIGTGPLDVGFMGVISAGTGSASVDFEIIEQSA